MRFYNVDAIERLQITRVQIIVKHNTDRKIFNVVESSLNVMAHGDAREGK